MRSAFVSPHGNRDGAQHDARRHEWREERYPRKVFSTPQQAQKKLRGFLTIISAPSRPSTKA
jgi:hypothetical protein